MVTSIPHNSRRYLALLCQAVLLLFTTALHAYATQASSAQLAYGLEIALPDSLSLEVIAPRDQFKHPIIAGKINGEPGYFIAATKINDWEKNAVLWKRLEGQIGKRSNRGEFTIHQRGSFSTEDKLMVFFRLYEYNIDNQTHRQVYFLLNSQRSGYWLTLTMVDDADANLITPLATALVRRARILD